MTIPELIRKHFPYERFNPGQYEAIEQAVTAILAGTKHIIMSAPTGVGKSAIATTIHRVVAESRMKQRRHRTTIITTTKGLQDQYVNEDHGIFDLKGKTNYDCPRGVGPYNSPKCRVQVGTGQCIKKKVCPYFTRREEWCKSADLRLTNTAFQIESPMVLVGDSAVRSHLVVVDECHDLPDQLVSHSTLIMNTKELSACQKLLGDPFINKFRSIIDSYSSMEVGGAFKPDPEQREAMLELHTAVEDAIEYLGELGGDSHSKSSTNLVGNAVEELQSVGDRLNLFADRDDTEWILTKYEAGEKMELQPVYAFSVAQHGIFRKSDQYVHMSATICGFESYRKSLGITESFLDIDIDNPIPVKNRPVRMVCNVAVSGNFDRELVAKTIDRLAKYHDGENGVVHTVSFKLAEEIKKNSSLASRMVISNDRKEILGLLRKPNGIIILSPSVYTGYDFKGDLCRWQVIAKVPYLYIGDPHVKLNMDRHPKWYARQAIVKIVQACGRNVRGIDDYGVTYVIDSNFNRLLKSNYELFPDWFLDSIVVKGK